MINAKNMMSRIVGPRVPFVQQHSATECGLACMAMILGYYGRATSLAELRELFPVGRDGFELRQIVKLAKHFGLDVKVYKTSGTNLQAIGFPVLVHWRFSHWVVVTSCNEKRAIILDPARSKEKVPEKEFSKCFTGVLVAFKPSDQFKKRRHVERSATWPFIYRLVGQIKGWRLLPLVIFSSVILQFLSLASPFIIKIVVDGFLPHNFTSAMNLLGTAMVVLTVTSVLAGLLRALAVLRLRTSLDLKATTEVLRQLLNLPFNFFQTHSRGDLISRVTGFSTIRQIVTDYGIASALDGIFMVVYLGWLYLLTPMLANVVLGFALLQVTALLVTNRAQERLAKAMYAASADEMSCLVDSLSAIDFLKASGSEEAAWERWSNLLRGELRADNKRAFLYAALSVISRACSIGGPLTVLWIGAGMVLAGRLTAGAMLSASAVAASIFFPLANVIYILQQLQGAAAHVERLHDIIASPKEVNAGDNMDFGGGIQAVAVSFSYTGSARPALSDVTVKIDPCKYLALVGTTGSGKSTLATLLIGLNSPSQGEIYFDGIPLSQLNRRNVRQQIGYVPQNPLLFRGTIRENVTFGTPNATLNDVIEACTFARMHDEIAQMPMGYDTVISEQGLNVSGGQRQRLAIARALIRRPRLLVLDEATSHLDSETEKQIHRTLAALSCTRIVIAHRLSTIKDADCIVVLDSGRIIEAGNHEELLAQEGKYAAMLKAQDKYESPLGV